MSAKEAEHAVVVIALCRRYFATALAPAVVYHALELHIFKKAGPQSWQSVTGPWGAFVSTDYPASRTDDGSVSTRCLPTCQQSPRND